LCSNKSFEEEEVGKLVFADGDDERGQQQQQLCGWTKSAVLTWFRRRSSSRSSRGSLLLLLQRRRAEMVRGTVGGAAREAQHMWSQLVHEKSVLPYLIPVFVLAWLLERWVIPLSSWIPVIISVWAALQVIYLAMDLQSKALLYSGFFLLLLCALNPNFFSPFFSFLGLLYVWRIHDYYYYGFLCTTEYSLNLWLCFSTNDMSKLIERSSKSLPN
jgi:hypothetical protein